MLHFLSKLFCVLIPIVLFKFFQSGSLQLSPVSVEITYGLERILMLLQVKEKLFDILFYAFLIWWYVFSDSKIILRVLIISRKSCTLKESHMGNFFLRTSMLAVAFLLLVV